MTTEMTEDNLFDALCFSEQDDTLENFTLEYGAVLEKSKEEIFYESTNYWCSNVLLPLIFLFGIIGNILNIVIFSRGRFRHALDEIEKSAVTGLVSLAVSDLVFCVLGVLSPVLTFPIYRSNGAQGFMEVAALYYRTYKAPMMNIFLFASTWLTVAVSLERYIAVRYPFRARWMIRVKWTICIDLLIYVVSIIFNILGFLQYQIVHHSCPDGTRFYFYMVNEQFYEHYTALTHAQKIIWTSVGTFLPLLLLAVFNAKLLIALWQSRSRSPQVNPSVHRYSASRITVILVSIVVLYMTLVCPSVILSLLREHMTTYNEATYFRYRTALVFTNVSQGINFAVNFLLYCAISRPFREHLSDSICRRTSPKTSSETQRIRMEDIKSHKSYSGESSKEVDM